MPLPRLAATWLHKRFKKRPGATYPPPLTTAQILVAEAKSIHGATLPEAADALYRELNGLKSAALCLSGGGIRSASFALGVIQALASHPRSASGKPVASADKSLLAQFHYLSTVSGGGYTGSWLSAWCTRVPFAAVWACLVGRSGDPDAEPAAISWLRSYSNYLTPKLGLTSADTWTLISIYVRNLVLNWAVILPAISVLVLLFQLIVFTLVEFSQNDDLFELFKKHPSLAYALQGSFLPLGILFLLIALRFTAGNRPSIRAHAKPLQSPGLTADQWDFLRGNLVWSAASALMLTQFFGSDKIGGFFETYWLTDLYIDVSGFLVPRYSLLEIVALVSIPSGFVYALGWWWGGRPGKLDRRDLILWSASGLAYGAVVGVGFWLYLLIPDIPDGLNLPPLLVGLLMNPIFYLAVGVPWILFAQWTAEITFIGLQKYRENYQDFDADQEWFGRAAGWLMAFAIAWFAVMIMIFAPFSSAACSVGNCSEDAVLQYGVIVGTLEYLIIPILLVAGFVIAVAGGGNLSGVHIEPKGAWSILVNILLAVAASLFIGALVFGLSIALDTLVLGQMLFDKDAYEHWPRTIGLLVAGLVLFAGVTYVTSDRININRFSLHALYRNRLIRAYLGASRQQRNPDQFSGFDPADNPPLHELWVPSGEGAGRFVGNHWRPFQIINMTLNVVSSERLSWQERKAAPFIATPLHCGTGITMPAAPRTGVTPNKSVGAYRPSKDYGGPQGITLGTAMAISGAATSPNMGYHSSPAITFLMTILNVRLGWWLGNPGPEGETTYTDQGPKAAIVPLLHETLGLTTEREKYIYLSDGGHFENLGLYEMVRRRCRFIVISDAARDPNFTFEDLGNAVRKIAIDLGVDVRFRNLQKLKGRPVGSDLGPGHVYYALGEIDYPSADGGGENGWILYVKAGYHGVESPGVRSYATANPDFPHQGTSNQWFTESQFESYRALGFEIMEGILQPAVSDEDYVRSGSIESLFGALAKRDVAPGKADEWS